MDLDIPALTFNQWIMAGTIVLFSIILLGWVCLCLFSKKFRNSIYRDIEDSPRIPDDVWREIWLREMYAIWAGRIFEIAGNIFGRETKPIGREHFFSVLVWILIIVCIAGYSDGFYNRDMWRFFGGLVVAATFVYATLNGLQPFRKPTDWEF